MLEGSPVTGSDSKTPAFPGSPHPFANREGKALPPLPLKAKRVEQGARSSPEAGPSRLLVRNRPLTNIWTDYRAQGRQEVILQEGESDWEAIGRPPFNLPKVDPGFIEDVISTPEWENYRLSLEATGVDEERIQELRDSDDFILYQWDNRVRSQCSPSASADTILPRETISSKASVKPVYHPKPQFPVDTIDLLEVVIANLRALAKETTREQEIQSKFVKTRQLLIAALEILKTVPKPRRLEYNAKDQTFAGYLKLTEDHLRREIFDVRNLYDPQLGTQIQNLASCYRAQELHQAWLLHKSRCQ